MDERYRPLVRLAALLVRDEAAAEHVVTETIATASAGADADFLRRAVLMRCRSLLRHGGAHIARTNVVVPRRFSHLGDDPSALLSCLVRALPSAINAGRECALPVLTALGQPRPGPVIVRCDRSRRPRAVWHRREAGLAEVSGFYLRGDQVRSELMNIDLAGRRGAVASHEQLRSELANKTSPATGRRI
jgi:hypothetical protein